MAVSLPTAANVRKVREQAARNAAERAEVARIPLLAVLGAGDLAVTTVTKAATQARTRAEDVQHRVTALPQRLSADELRRAVADLREQAEKAYAGFAERGEQAWGRIRTQPQVRNALATIESYTEKFDARVDDLVDDAHDAAEKALNVVTRQARSTGEKVARSSQRLAAETAETVTAVSKDASKIVADAGAEVAGEVTDAGDELAHEARSTARKAADRTTPRTAPKPAARRPATPTAAVDANGTTTGS